MQGTMLWFNVDKGHGFIRTEEDERLYVARDGFLPDHRPAPRCKGRAVRFDREATGADARAVNVSFVAREEPRRARLHGGRGGLRH
ncbi:MAG TPA: hypothetical protein VFL66_07835 [Gaiellaceae bacterium]|nr:hypothetical protein [Gaiellaceae bacterium]